MLPIPYLFTRRSGWSGTYSQPNFLWYDFAAATASTDTNDKNTVSTTGTFSRAYDFSGSSRHSNITQSILWRSNIQNGKSAVRQISGDIGYVAWQGAVSSTSSSWTAFMACENKVNTIPITYVYKNGYVDATLRGNRIPYAGFNDSLYSAVSTCDFGTGSFIYFGQDDKSALIYGVTASQSSGIQQASLYTNLGTNYASYATTCATVPGLTGGNVTEQFGAFLPAAATFSFFEIMIWDRILTPTECEDVLGYLNNKWMNIQ